MSSTLPAFSKDEFENERERREAGKRRKSMRRERKKNPDPADELKALRKRRRKKPEEEEEECLDGEDLELNDDFDLGYRDGDEFSDKFEQSFFDDWD
jgi:hypothetical protein